MAIRSGRSAARPAWISGKRPAGGLSPGSAPATGTNLGIGIPTLSISPAYLRTIEPSRALALGWSPIGSGPFAGRMHPTRPTGSGAIAPRQAAGTPNERCVALDGGLGRRHMRVKLCARCPYTPRDLAHHYDPEAALYACAKCDSEQDQCETRWRRKCSTTIGSSCAQQQIDAPFARESSGSSAITAREPRSAQRSASTISGRGERATQDGCGVFGLPDGAGCANGAQLSLHPASVDRETVC